jgi:glycosyltransferase involved in cell wall biosynthesis
MTDVSVVVPTRDRAAFLMRTLATVAGQRGVDLEVIVVDDGSVDPRATLAATDVAVGVRYLRHERPLGVSAARNRGVDAAVGRWIAFLDDDDLWAPEKLSAQVGAAEDQGTAWAYTGDVNVDTHLRVLSGGPPSDPDAVMRDLARYNPIASGASNVLVRKDVLDEVGGFDPSLRRTEDWDLWIRLARVGRPSCVARPLVAYTFHPANATAIAHEIVEEPRVLASRYGIAVDGAAMQRRAAWVSLRAGRRWAAARRYASAVALGDLRSIGRAAVALTYPGIGGDGVFRLLPRDPAWVRDAESWLVEIAGALVEGSPRR